MKNHRFLQRKYLVNAYPDRELILTEGDGVFIMDREGNRYLDLMTNYGVNIFGHRHPKIHQAIRRQLDRLVTLHGSFNSDVRAEAARALVLRCGGGLARVFLSNSGAEAVEAALKFASLATGKKRFISCLGGYHGKTMGALSASGEDRYRVPFEPLFWDFQRVGYNDLSGLERALDADTAAFLIEPIQGEAGVIPPDPGYLKEAREICAQQGILMIIDEIQTGVGRTGTFLASEPELNAFDIVCLGKGLAGGIPVGATLVSEPVAEKIPRSVHTSTFGGNPLAAAGILAVLDLLDDNMLVQVRNMGRNFMDSLKSLSHASVKDVRGRGMMLGVEVSGIRNRVLRGLQRERILAAPAGDHVVRFLPPLTLREEHVQAAVGTLDRVLRQVDPDAPQSGRSIPPHPGSSRED